VVWIVIYLGCAITIGFSYFFGSNVFRAQEIMCASFSILLGMTILAIIELAHPYQGVVTISNEPFRYALSRMKETEAIKVGARTTLEFPSTPTDRVAALGMTPHEEYMK
jgi:hypothetical protein